MELAKLGVQNLHVWDFDKIEPHNLANQCYALEDVGEQKVDALAKGIKRYTGLEVTTHNEAVTGRTRLGEVVFLLTDTMASRKEIWKGAIAHNPMIKRMIETRMGVDVGRVYSVRPTSLPEAELWEDTLCSDDEATDSVCGASVTVGPTAELVSAYALWAFLGWLRWEQTGEREPKTEAIFYAYPPAALVRTAELLV